ncbi:MAG: 4'-phosphopantetheinyl transferase superfamily protein [Chloroflexi bacterium]|nr:4'-phosphopantetheinyl transferase superfamily protein [Chloroflexota bacterium]MCC6892479.1 4'-phosphopantetheinyl transferase superfamily protein [Anaerolineae bacterium]
MVSYTALTAGVIHLWRIDLDGADQRLPAWNALLAPDEAARAAAFYFERDQRRYAAGRGILRTLLGHYAHQPPRDLLFSYNPQGKPSLLGFSYLHFNLAHSNTRAVLAVGIGQPLGADIEHLRTLDDIDSLARNTFSINENAVFARVPPHQKVQVFFNCWTRKEAYIKAIGEGLSHPLDSFDVSLLPGEPARVLRVAGQPEEANRWTLHSFNIGTDYTGAVAVRQPVTDVQTFDWPLGEI